MPPTDKPNQPTEPAQDPVAANDKLQALETAAATAAQAYAEQAEALNNKITALETENTALETENTALKKQVKNKMTKKSREIIRAKLIDKLMTQFHSTPGQSNTQRATSGVDFVLEELFPKDAAAGDEQETEHELGKNGEKVQVA